MVNDIIDYIKYECIQCMIQISGQKLNAKTRVITIKGPKERYVIEGFQLDVITKSISCFSYVIENLSFFYHFSKFLKSYAIKEKTAENALLCIKYYSNCLGFPKILQLDNNIKMLLLKNFSII